MICENPINTATENLLTIEEYIKWLNIPLGYFDLISNENKDGIKREIMYRIGYLNLKIETKQIILDVFQEYGCL